MARSRLAVRLCVLTLLASAALAPACGGDVDVNADADAGPDGGATVSVSVACNSGEPILQEGTELDSGFVRCDDEFVHRAAPVECADPTGVGDAECQGECSVDADCNAKPFGTCVQEYPWGCNCSYGCRTDADCAADQACACAGTAGPRARCVAAPGCRTSADCGGGLCGLVVEKDACGASYPALACLTADSGCRRDQDCQTAKCPDESSQGWDDTPRDFVCEITEGVWACEAPSACNGPCG